MCRTIKFILIPTICLGLIMGLTALAQETTVEEEIKLDEEVEPGDLEIKEPKLLPDNPFYFLKEWERGIMSFFAFGRIKKLELEQKFANEKLMELKALVEKNGDPKILEKATEKYERVLEKIRTRAQNIKQKAEENKEVEEFFNKFTRHQLLHQRVLQKLENQVPSEVFEKIESARKKHLENFGEVMTILEDRTEKIKENLEENMNEAKGSKYKNFKNLEILIGLEEKIPEQAKEAIRKAQENAFKRLQDDLEKMSLEDQEEFKEYIDKISGDKEKQLEILENLRLETREQIQLREKINEMREGIIERVQQKNQEKTMVCPEINRPAPDFCSEGRIIIEKDENGCVTSFKCVIPAEIEIPTTPSTEPKPFCINLWDPVCGTNGKTYSNSCYAKISNVEIAYKGECREKECETDTDCPQPRCGPAGTISARCMGVKTKCVEGKCQIVEE